MITELQGRNLVRLLVIIMVTGSFARAALAETIHVKSAPEAQQAMNRARPGDEIVLANGTYADFVLNLSATGDSARPVVLRAASPGKVIFTGEPALDITGSYIEVRDLTLRDCARVTAGKRGPVQFDHSTHCRLTGCSFEHSRFSSYAVVTFRNAAKDNRLDHCSFIDSRNRAVVVLVDDNSLHDGPPLRNRIDHNLFRDVPPLGRNGSETIQIGQSAVPYAELRPETLVENNLFVHCDGESEIISVKTTGNTIRHNLFRDCDGEVVNRTGHENVYEGNRFEGCTGGIRISGHGHRITDNVIIRSQGAGICIFYGTPDNLHPAAYLPVYGCVITNNTIIDCGQFGILVGGKRNARNEYKPWAGSPWFASAVMECTIAPHENRISKNIVTGSKGILIKLDETPDNMIKDNLVYATGDATLGDTGERPHTEDPGFKNAGAGDYRLLPAGAARTNGIGAAAEPFSAGPDAE